MSSSTRPARVMVAVAAALLLAYVLVWLSVSNFDIGRSDFTAFYVGGTLLRGGHGAQLYNEAVQLPLHTALIAPDTEGNLPFVNSPVAAALVAPVTMLDLHLAYRIWGALELGLLILAVVIAVRSAPWPERYPRIWKLAAGMAALASMGTWTVLAQAQWTPIVALGLALAYRDWRRGNDARGAAVLVMTAAIAKPHLALGLVAFMLGWRNRRVIVGALGGALAFAVASLLLVGPAGIAGFFGIVASSTTRWDLRTMLSVVGLAGTYLGNGAAARITAAVASVAACAVAYWLGSRVRRDQRRLDVALAGATVLSLLAAPHAYPHDLALLAPVLAWSVALAVHRSGVRLPSARRGRPLIIVVGLWTVINVAALVDFSDRAAFPPGQMTALTLIAAAAVAWVASDTVRDGETAVGSLAHGLRRRRVAAHL